MTTITMEYKEPIEIEVRVYDVTIDGEEIGFLADLDCDGDIRIELEKNSFEENAVKYLRYNNTDEELKEMFGLGD